MNLETIKHKKSSIIYVILSISVVISSLFQVIFYSKNIEKIEQRFLEENSLKLYNIINNSSDAYNFDYYEVVEDFTVIQRIGNGNLINDYNKDTAYLLYDSLVKVFKSRNLYVFTIELNNKKYTAILTRNKFDTYLNKELTLYNVILITNILVLVLVAIIVIKYNYSRIKTLSELRMHFMEGILLLLSYKSEFTGNHSVQVAKLSNEIAKRLFPRNTEFHRDIFLCGLLHDLGKINTKNELLDKPSKLSEIEYQELKQHTIIGSNILKDFCKKTNYLFDGLVNKINNCILYHHEKYNGEGYPFGLTGRDIPLEARIVAVADVFDALYSERPYKKGYKLNEVLDFIVKESGKHFDPVIVEVLLQMCKDESFINNLYNN